MQLSVSHLQQTAIHEVRKDGWCLRDPRSHWCFVSLVIVRTCIIIGGLAGRGCDVCASIACCSSTAREAKPCRRQRDGQDHARHAAVTLRRSISHNDTLPRVTHLHRFLMVGVLSVTVVTRQWHNTPR